VLGFEFAGEVEALGSRVTEVAIGDRVIGSSLFGGYCELAVARAESLLALPDHWSYEEGAAVPLNYATAYAALVRFGNLCRGERVLIHAAAGGVGVAATQVARLLGAGEIFGTASRSKHQTIRSFGIDHPIDYRTSDFRDEIRRITGSKRPLDVVLDAVGGGSLRRSYALLRPGGRLVAYGAASAISGGSRNLKAILAMAAATPIFHPIEMMASSRAVIGLDMIRLWLERGTLDDFLAPLAPRIAEDQIRPVIDAAFPLERGAQAHRHLEEHRNLGKVVLTP
jgi:NADPH:quinone reductase-like Zn-dependent oxidoreductase